MTTNFEKKKCPVCEKHFSPTRRDQIYCRYNGIKCRNSYNNEKARGFRNIIKPIHERLVTNRKVLEKVLTPSKEKVFSTEYLKGAGFDFGYYTHNKAVNEKDIIHMVFDYGLTPIESGKYKVAYYGRIN